MSTQDLSSLIKRLEAVADRLEKSSSGSSSGGSGSSVASGEQVQAYDDYYGQAVKPWLELSKKIGGDLEGANSIIEETFAEVRKVIDVASKSKKPSDEVYGNLVKPIMGLVKKLDDYVFKKNRGPMANHLRGLGDGIKLVQWVAVPNTPVPFVKDMVEAARFYHNKVLVEYKKKEEEVAKLHKDWVNGWANLGNELAAYVKEHHTTGLKWNPKGSDSLASAGSAPQPKAQPKVQQTTTTSSKPGAGAKANLFASLNKGGAITSGLKKVKKEQKTKYQTGPKPKVAFQSKAKKVKRITGTPVTELQRGVKWVVENHDGNKKVEIEGKSLKETAYIYKCDNSNIIVKGKLNSITLDNCQKTNLVFDSLVAVCDVVNCKSVKVQILGKVPTVQIDKTDGIIVYLNDKTLDTTFVTSKSSEMNISVPTGNDDFKEHPLPEQYVSAYKDGKFTTEVSSLFS